jgi:solute carrier family 35 (UDP-galactose transporter), member B1
MILSVVIYNHQLTLGQWAGAAVVFGGISVEAWVKRKGKHINSLFLFLCSVLISLILAEVHAKRIIAEKEKAKIKSL